MEQIYEQMCPRTPTPFFTDPGFLDLVVSDLAERLDLKGIATVKPTDNPCKHVVEVCDVDGEKIDEHTCLGDWSYNDALAYARKLEEKGYVLKDEVEEAGLSEIRR